MGTFGSISSFTGQIRVCFFFTIWLSHLPQAVGVSPWDLLGSCVAIRLVISGAVPTPSLSSLTKTLSGWDSLFLVALGIANVYFSPVKFYFSVSYCSLFWTSASGGSLSLSTAAFLPLLHFCSSRTLSFLLLRGCMRCPSSYYCTRRAALFGVQAMLLVAAKSRRTVCHSHQIVIGRSTRTVRIVRFHNQYCPINKY